MLCTDCVDDVDAYDRCSCGMPKSTHYLQVLNNTTRPVHSRCPFCKDEEYININGEADYNALPLDVKALLGPIRYQDVVK